MLRILIWLRVWPKNKSSKFVTEIEFLVQNSGQDPSRCRNPYFHTRYSNGNILSFWYQNQSIQKPKFIYPSRNTTLMKESNRFKKQNHSRGRNPYFHTRYSNKNILSFWYRNQAIQKPKFIYASRTTTLMKELNWDKIILNNRIWQ
jgi:hypothetical protein